MVTITTMANIDYSAYDEVWAIVRSLKYTNPNIKHVPELSPSWSLFRKYLSLRENGQWNEETFHNIYVPRFLKEMRGTAQQKLLNELFNTKKHICLACFCPDECLCHRIIIGGMLQGAGLEVRGLSADYSHYFDWWKNGVPGVTDTPLEAPERVNLTEYNNNVKYLYGPKPDRELFTDKTETMCFTGRRPKDLCWYDTWKYKAFVDDLAKLIYEEFYVGRDVRRFINGGAQGFDQMAFWAVNKMKTIHACNDIQNIVVVPFEGQDGRWSEKGLFSQTEYRMMIKNADMVAVACEDADVDAMFTRNRIMCDISSHCLGLYPDSSWKVNRGGTAGCLRYAVNHCRSVFRLGYRIDEAGLHMGKMLEI